jgi:hypothetical protein
MLGSLACCRVRNGARGVACGLQLGRLMLALLAGMVHGAPQGLLSVTDLTGRGPAAGPWSLSNGNGSVAVSGVALPSYVLETLQARNVIPDPLVR